VRYAQGGIAMTILPSQLAPVNPPNSFEFNKLPVSDPAKSVDKDSDPKIDFRTLLQSSNADIDRERAAKKTGDLSAAKTDAEFRSMLAEKANPTRAPKNTLGKDDFMKLFIAQMQAQDPLNPQDSSQMAAQMAQFNGLEQMMNVNKTLETMLASQTTDRAIGMVNYVGKEVDIGNGMLKWDKTKLTKSSFEVDQPLANSFIEVRDSAGQVIAQEDLGNLMPGEHNLKWDGQLKDGSIAGAGIYHFGLIGKTLDGQDVPLPIKSKVKVTGIDLQAPGGAFFTELGKISIKDVASVGVQGFDVERSSAMPPAPSRGGAGSGPNQGLPNQELVPELDPAAIQNGLPPEITEAMENSNPAQLTEPGREPSPEAMAQEQLAQEQMAKQQMAQQQMTSEPSSAGRNADGNMNIPVTIAKK
jgi:flagellar basal-body rod modification protein FlgD